ncbi:putative DNA repair photolyase-like protein [Desulfosarcina variabilis str. Montpellier]|uniref:SPL family radical SAM protein n=1 Tax=Desulfosarcina variabilis TaxID=2300 RepID=UPI003AFB2491
MSIHTLFVDTSIESYPETQQICRKLNLPTEKIEDPITLFQYVNRSADPIATGKQVLYLTRNKGGFFKKCPGTREYICCDYKILHVASFCTMDCSYCILQSYFHPPVLQFFVNREDLDAELDDLFLQERITRVGTGEFTDSLIWEPWTDLNEHLVSRFAAQDKAVLELKTKTVNIQRLKGLDHQRKTILAWSLNTPYVMKHEERRTASLSARLTAASTCQQCGYPLAFHFDPMVIYPGCEADYQQVVNMLFEKVSPENIVWISIGTFRYMPPLKSVIAKRFPASKIAYGEFITGLDNKMRYFKPLRIALYRQMVDWIRKAAPDVTVYYCMEDDQVWQQTMDWVPAPDGGLGRLLDNSAAAICNLNP